ncbi:MAG: hypothetical protein LBT71_11705 [Azoarcus sp.]|jgi:hypothetical protein|nr:hypothetical protein [Azoarcus sp.]
MKPSLALTAHRENIRQVIAAHHVANAPRSVPFFGMALFYYLQPQRLILVGTAGSRNCSPNNIWRAEIICALQRLALNP